MSYTSWSKFYNIYYIALWYSCPPSVKASLFHEYSCFRAPPYLSLSLQARAVALPTLLPIKTLTVWDKKRSKASGDEENSIQLIIIPIPAAVSPRITTISTFILQSLRHKLSILNQKWQLLESRFPSCCKKRKLF
jgi:hypothetical protein